MQFIENMPDYKSHIVNHSVPKKPCRNSPSGFTLMELIMVMVLLGVFGMLSSNFISQAFKGYKSTDSRLEIYEEGKTALVRMERELHNAIPNAIDETTLSGTPSDLRFGVIDEDAMHCDVSVTPLCNAGDYVFGQYSDKNPVGKSFIKDQSKFLPAGSIISIYNRSWDDFDNPAPATQRIYDVTSTAGIKKMNLDRNVNASSPNKRFYAVDQAVRYFLDGTTLERETATVAVGSSVSFTGAGKPLARNVSNLTFAYEPGSLTRNAIVTIDLTVAKNGESVSFHKEVQIRNVP